MSSSTTSFRQRLQIQTTMGPPPWPGGGAVSPEQQQNQQQHRSPISRPPLSPRCYSAAAVTGQSRFVEGSMNDRVSAAPPPGFLGYDEGSGTWEVQGQQQQNQQQQQQQQQQGERYHLRRPRSTAAWVGLGTVAQAQQGGKTQEGQGQQQQQQQQRGGVTKKSSFLAPLWDGVREKLHLSKSKSSGSIGRVMNSVVGERREKERVVASGVDDREKMPPPAQPALPPPSSTTGYPSREEVLESYKNLVASGFFEAHAIRGGRHPLRTGGNAAAPEQGRSFAEHMGTMSSPAGKSFADHMAAQQQSRPALPFSSPTRPPPPPPPRFSSQGKVDTIPSPQRGTKRGASIDLAGETEMVTRKLVKKLRYSASRLSIELSGAREKRSSNYSLYGTVRSRPSTSSNGPLSPTSSVFSGITSTNAPIAESSPPVTHSKITKAKDDRPRRLMRLGRRNRISTAAPTSSRVEADPDAMVLDEPSTTADQAPKPPRKSTPPPATFRTQHPRSGMRSSSTSSSVMSLDHDNQHNDHEPLSVVPDPNQGIPFVPRIPREFCDAMADLVPSSSAAAAMGGAVVVVPGQGKGEMMMETDGKGKGTVNRDSGLGGEDVENLPVWG